jgi:hypothetical protein
MQRIEQPTMEQMMRRKANFERKQRQRDSRESAILSSDPSSSGEDQRRPDERRGHRPPHEAKSVLVGRGQPG